MYVRQAGSSIVLAWRLLSPSWVWVACNKSHLFCSAVLSSIFKSAKLCWHYWLCSWICDPHLRVWTGLFRYLHCKNCVEIFGFAKSGKHWQIPNKAAHVCYELIQATLVRNMISIASQIVMVCLYEEPVWDVSQCLELIVWHLRFPSTCQSWGQKGYCRQPMPAFIHLCM